MALYGPAHPVAAGALDLALRKLGPLLSGRASLTLIATQERLELDGDALPLSNPAVARLHREMRLRLIRSLALKPGLEAWELASLLEVLARDPDELLEAGGPAAALAARDPPHLRLSGDDFSSLLRESEAAWRDAFPQAAGALGKPLQALMQFCLTPFQGDLTSDPSVGPSPAGPGTGIPLPAELLSSDAEDLALNEVEIPPEDCFATSLAHLIQRSAELTPVQSEQERRAWYGSLASYLRELEPSLRARVFRAPAGGSPGHPDALTLVARDFTLEEAVALVTDHPRPVTGERSDQLGRLLSRIMSDDERLRALEPVLRQRLLALGLEEDLYRNIVALLIEQIAKELYLGRPERARHQRELHFLSSYASGPLDINDLLVTTSPPAVSSSRRSLLRELLKNAASPAQFANAAELIVSEAQTAACDDETDQLARLLLALKREAEPERRDSGRKAIAHGALGRAGSPAVVSRLLALLPELPTHVQNEIISLLGHLGEGGRGALLALARGQIPSPCSQAAVRLMALLDDRADLELRTLLLSSSGPTLFSLMKTLISMRERSAQAHLLALFDHPSPAARLQLVQLAREHPGPGSEDILLQALGDPDPEIQARAAQGLGEMNSERALPSLCKLVQAGPAWGPRLRVRAAAAAALGKIASPLSAPVLSRLLLRGGLRLRLLGCLLRLQVAQALASIPSPVAQQALQAGLADRSRAVRQACEQGLHAWCQRFAAQVSSTP